MILALLAWSWSTALAQDDDGWGDEGDDVGFGDFDVATEPVEVKAASPLSAGGTVRTTESLWVQRFDTDPFAKARQSVDLWSRYKAENVRAEVSVHTEIDLPYWLNRDDWDDQTFDTYAWQVVPREALVAVSAGPLEITAGRQLIVWGEGQLLSPVDVVAARDMRDPGLADLDDMRLPVAALKLGYFAGNHRVELIGVPEFDVGFIATPQGPYGPIDALLAESDAFTSPLVAPLLENRAFVWEHRQSRWDLDQLQGFARWRMSGSAVDLGLYAGSLLDKQGNLRLPDVLDLLGTDDLALGLDHKRYTMVGHSGSGAAGPVLFTWEVAAHIGKAFDTADLEALAPEIVSVKSTLVSGMGGVQYSGVQNTTMTLEVAGGVFAEPVEDQLYPADMVNYGLRLSHQALRERLRLGLTGMGMGVDFKYGGLVRADATYELADGVRAGLGGIVYRPGSERGPLLAFDSHDQFFVQGRWDF